MTIASPWKLSENRYTMGLNPLVLFVNLERDQVLGHSLSIDSASYLMRQIKVVIAVAL